MTSTTRATPTDGLCLHCRSLVPPDASDPAYCCTGCREVAALLSEQGLGRYYDLARGATPPKGPAGKRSHAWLEPVVEAAETQGDVCRTELDVQGVHCAACVWLMSELFKRRDGGLQCTVNPAVGKVALAWRKGAFDVEAWVAEVERFGYAFGPGRKTGDEKARGLMLRIGISAALTMNTMMLSAAFYMGLAPQDGDLYRFFGLVSLLLTTGVVLVGGAPFFRAAFEGLRRRVLHLDVPIALGILLVYGATLAQAWQGRFEVGYADTLDTFVTLMLVGRLLQQRLIERNRSYLLDDAGADAISVRRITGDRLEVVPASGVRRDDTLFIAPGEVVPVDAALVDAEAACSLDWISGESAPRRFVRGQTVPAGAFNAGASALTIRARTDFADSRLMSLMRATHATEAGRAVILTRATRWYVPAVLLLSAAAWLLWSRLDPSRALDVTAALLVVTCPCAIGIAVPLAYELAFAALRRRGVFVRTGDLLDRLLQVRRVMFDKTGTLTLASLELAEPWRLEKLDEGSRTAVYAMASRSSHPVSRCLSAALERHGSLFQPDALVREVPGEGLELVRADGTWRLGRARFALGGAEASRATVLSHDGEVMEAFELRERLRPGTRRGVDRLRTDGMEIWLVSGDVPERVAEVAAGLGLAPEHVLSRQLPEQKAAAVERLDRHDTLFIGDGVNDALAFSKAFAAGTPAVDRPVMPGKADFFLLGESLDGLSELMATSRRLQAAIRRNVGLALAYNAAAVAVCFAGWMTPLRAAIAMPLSSLSVLALTTWSLKRGDDRNETPATAAAPRTMEAAL